MLFSHRTLRHVAFLAMKGVSRATFWKTRREKRLSVPVTSGSAEKYRGLYRPAGPVPRELVRCTVPPGPAPGNAVLCTTRRGPRREMPSSVPPRRNPCREILPSVPVGSRELHEISPSVPADKNGCREKSSSVPLRGDTCRAIQPGVPLGRFSCREKLPAVPVNFFIWVQRAAFLAARYEIWYRGRHFSPRDTRSGTAAGFSRRRVSRPRGVYRSRHRSARRRSGRKLREVHFLEKRRRALVARGSLGYSSSKAPV